MTKLFTELVVLAANAVSYGAVGKLREARIAAGRDLLLERVRVGDISIEAAAEQDEAIAMMLKFCEVSREGAASENLALLAEVLADRLQHRPIMCGDYLLLSDVVKGLSGEEIVFLGLLWQAYQGPPPALIQNKDAYKEARDRAHAALVGPGKLCLDFEQFEMIGSGLIRTGFVVLASLIGPHNSFRPTQRLDKLVRDAKLLAVVEGLLEKK